jgi:NTE family protein
MERRKKANGTKPIKTVNLALQGGGAHGAFAWGVLDRLLEDERLTFEGISACSAGAMNAVVLAHGLAEGGRDGAKASLADFWRRISRSALFSPLQPSPLDRLARNHSLETSPAFVMLDLATRTLSPYQFNPANYNPLRDILAEAVDFEGLRKSAAVKLFLSATNVCTGKVKIFRNEEVSLDAVMASACLPRPACPTCSRRWRSTASAIGTAATWETRPSSRSSTTARARISWWSTSTRSSAATSPGRPRRS